MHQIFNVLESGFKVTKQKAREKLASISTSSSKYKEIPCAKHGQDRKKFIASKLADCCQRSFSFGGGIRSYASRESASNAACG